MKHFLTILICFCALALSGQSKIELYGGFLQNNFFSRGADSPHYNASYQSGRGFKAGIGVDSVKLDWMTLHLTLQWEHYSGNLSVYDGGQGGGDLIQALVNKSLLSLGTFPVNFHPLKRMEISLGVEMAALMEESFDGTISGWRMNEADYRDDLHDRLSRFSCRGYIGLAGKVSYDIPLSESFLLAPQVNYYYPLSGEFKSYIPETKSMRWAFCLGIKKQLHLK